MKNKTVLVTGASRGIGKEIGILFAQKNMNVIFNYCYNKEKATQIVDNLNNNGARAVALKADVSQKSEVEKMIKKANNIFGEIDILINNAGISQQKLFTDISENDWNRMFDINIKGIYNCTQAVLPAMIRKQSGKIINISSIWGLVGASCEVHYSASKAAVIGLTKALAKELGPSKIQVNCVAPGVIETQMLDNLSPDDIKNLKYETPLGIIGKPSDIANTVYFLASDLADFITGQVISPNGGFVI
ncbi:MAG: SDR family oxidoreductase [Oscillospiraceae bacterium]|nr:SDR family oxidoreductase [Oscillospiraceae bacterium]